VSHSSGKVKFEDGTELWFEYNGTVDVCMPMLYSTIEELDESWRKGPYRMDCTCGSDETVTINSNYGSNHKWNGKACRNCMCITEGLNPYEDKPDPDYGWRTY
jgi:hypothetical protein